jgi:REP element-mobilizing transposase RayT
MPRKHIKRIRHARRPDVSGAVHVTVRIRAGLPNMRTPRAYRALERAFRKGKEKGGFRLVQYAVLSNHMHLFVDADDKTSLAKGMQALQVRIARALNKHWHRKGRLFFDRYHSRAIEQSLHQIKKVLRYILQNARKHGVSLPKGEADPYSSARWFNWWQKREMRRPLRSPPVAEPSRCITTAFAHQHGLSIDDLPGPRLHFDPF